MSKKFIARLQLLLDGRDSIPPNPTGIYSPEFVKRYTYKLHLTPKAGASSMPPRHFQGPFTKLRSHEHGVILSEAQALTAEQANALYGVTWEIYFDGKLNHSFAGKLFDPGALQTHEWTRFNIKFTKAQTKPLAGTPHLVTQAISWGVGWYLVKKQEAFGDLMARAFKKPTQQDWDAMRSVNAHLGNLTSLTLLKPGQVVVFSRTKNHSNPKLQAMMTAAQKAQATWESVTADGHLAAEELVLIDLLMQGHKLVPISADEVEGLTSEHKARALGLTDDYKPYTDAMIGLAAANFDSATEAHRTIAMAAHNVPYTTPKGTAKRAVREAAQSHPKQFRLLNDSAYARKLIYWDTGIKANRARDYINAQVQLRSARTVDDLSLRLAQAGKFSRLLRTAGYVGVVIDAGVAGIKAHDSYSKGDVRNGNIEAGKGVGSILFGVGGGAVAGAATTTALVAIGIGTGGIGLVVIGIVAATASYYAGKVGEKIGESTADAYNDSFVKHR